MSADSQQIGFVQLMRSVETNELLKDNKAFVLLAVIALRARRTSGLKFRGLEIGEAAIGDYEAYGMSRGQYRAACDRLRDMGLITTRTTNRGTIAKLVNTSVFNPNLDPNNQQGSQPGDQQATIKQPTSDHPATTNKNEKWSKPEEGEESFHDNLHRLRGNPTIETAIAAIYTCHPAFQSVPRMYLENSLRGQPNSSRWIEAIEGLASTYAGAKLERPNRTLQNWLAGKPGQSVSDAITCPAEITPAQMLKEWDGSPFERSKFAARNGVSREDFADALRIDLADMKPVNFRKKYKADPEHVRHVLEAYNC